MNRKIYYWADGVWCDTDEVEYMGHRSDDFGTISVPWDLDEEDIDRIVHDACSGRAK